LKNSAEWKKYESERLEVAELQKGPSKPVRGPVTLDGVASSATTPEVTPEGTAARQAGAMETAAAPSPEILKAQRERALQAAQERWPKLQIKAGNPKPVAFAWIYAAAGVDKHDAYQWKSGKLPDSSKMSAAIEKVLQQVNPPRNPKPDSH
jgi:hypothetical protein